MGTNQRRVTIQESIRDEYPFDALEQALQWVNEERTGESLATLAECKAETDAVEEAISIAREAIDRWPTESFGYFALAYALEKQRGHLAEAEEAIQTALRMSRDVADYHALWGQIRLGQSDLVGAWNAAMQAWKLDPQCRLAHFVEGGISYHLMECGFGPVPQNNQPSPEDLETASRAARESSQGYALRDTDPARAAEHFAASLRIAPAQHNVRIELKRCLERLS